MSHVVSGQSMGLGKRSVGEDHSFIANDGL